LSVHSDCQNPLANATVFPEACLSGRGTAHPTMPVALSSYGQRYCPANPTCSSRCRCDTGQIIAVDCRTQLVLAPCRGQGSELLTRLQALLSFITLDVGQCQSGPHLL
jgi:hypothetical protein